jgi:hypothetical protein
VREHPKSLNGLGISHREAIVKILLSAIMLMSSSASADLATQSDWTGGPGVTGPGFSWGNDFSLETQSSWYATAGEVGCFRVFSGTEHPIAEDFNAVYSVNSADIDGDGDPDVLAAAEFDDEIAWWKNVDGTGTNWQMNIVEAEYNGARWATGGDIDGDGDMDILGTGFWAHRVDWWENIDGPGTVWAKHLLVDDYEGPWNAQPADIDGDGDLDIVTISYYGDDVDWWENLDGAGDTWSRHVIASTYDGPSFVLPLDVDDDGDIDVAAAALSSNNITLWRNADGAGGTWELQPVAYAEGMKFLCSGDLDGDGDLDLGAAAYDGDDVFWCENANGLGTNWAPHMLASSYPNPFGIAAFDNSGDQDIDLVSIGTSDTRIILWENTGKPLSIWKSHPIGHDLNGPYCVLDVDIDGDAVPDFLLAEHGGDALSWWKLDSSYVTSGMLESSILYTGCDPGWGALLWSGETPSGTAIGMQVRASDDFTQMGAWSYTLWAPSSLQGLLEENDSYFQYRVILSSATSDTTPVLTEVTVTWEPLGIDEGGTPAAMELMPVSPNPSNGAVTLDYGLPSTVEVELAVYDVSGRVAQRISLGACVAGWHSVQLDELSPGIYFVRMTAGEFSGTQRFVVLSPGP